jgi:hypothetical protein
MRRHYLVDSRRYQSPVVVKHRCSEWSTGPMLDILPSQFDDEIHPFLEG